MSKLITLMFACASVAVAPSALADEPLPVGLGNRIRFVAPSVAATLMIGKVVAMDEKTLEVSIEGRAGNLILKHEDVARLELSKGKRSRGRGALLGAGVGAAAALVLGAALGNPGGEDNFAPQDVMALFAVLTVPVGALTGLALPPGERWHTVPLTRRPGVAARNLVSVTLRF